METAQAADLHRAVPGDVDLPRILAVHEDRVVQNYCTVRWQNAFLQLGRTCGLQPKAHVTVCAQLDGRARLFVGERELAWSPTRTEPVRTTRSRPRRSGPTGSTQDRKPADKPPWRRAIVTF